MFYERIILVGYNMRSWREKPDQTTRVKTKGRVMLWRPVQLFPLKDFVNPKRILSLSPKSKILVKCVRVKLRRMTPPCITFLPHSRHADGNSEFCTWDFWLSHLEALPVFIFFWTFPIEVLNFSFGKAGADLGTRHSCLPRNWPLWSLSEEIWRIREFFEAQKRLGHLSFHHKYQCYFLDSLELCIK